MSECGKYDFPFVTGLSVESSIAFGDKMVVVLAIAPTPRWKFYKKHLNYFFNKDVEGLVKNDYNEDAVLAEPDFVVQGHDALREIFTGYLEMIGDMTLKTTDKFVETENSIYLEATLQTSNLGERKVTDTFVLKDGKISYHFTVGKGREEVSRRQTIEEGFAVWDCQQKRGNL